MLRADAQDCAVILFADPLASDLSRRALPARAAALLSLPDVAAAGADLFLYTTDPRATSADETRELRVRAQRGSSFGDRLCNAVEEVAVAGYRRIAIVGRDCPDLTSADVSTALAALADRRLVVGPDHRGGCYLIALHAEDRHLLENVRWQHDEDREALLIAFGRDRSMLLAVKFDLDTLDDVRQWAAHRPDVAMVLHLGEPFVARPAAGPGLPWWARVVVGWQIPPPASFHVA